MYLHFAVRLPRWARPLITAAQIVQLAFVTGVWSLMGSLCGGVYATYATEHPAAFAVPYALVPVYLYFFLVFFWNSYCAPARAPKSGVRKAAKGE